MSCTLLDLPAETLALVPRFKFEEQGPADFGRIEIYEEPDPEGMYGIGADFALGLENRDWDTAVALRMDVTPVRQVAEVQVHLGEQFDRVLWPLIVYYNEGFLCGERQFGLGVMRSILNTYGHGWMYYDRDEETRSRRITDKLGYWRSTGDVCIPHLRRALMQQQIVIRSRELLRQLRNLQYAPKSNAIDSRDALDKHMGIKLKGGGSPDLVMALAYAWHGCEECPKFERPVRRYAPGSLGEILGHELLDKATGRKDLAAYFRGRRAKPGERNAARNR